MSQPPPTPGQKRVLDLVLEDLKHRAELGKERYGTYLETHNGRNALVDSYEEALDLVMYLRQELAERGDTPPDRHEEERLARDGQRRAAAGVLVYVEMLLSGRPERRTAAALRELKEEFEWRAKTGRAP